VPTARGNGLRERSPTKPERVEGPHWIASCADRLPETLIAAIDAKLATRHGHGPQGLVGRGSE